MPTGSLYEGRFLMFVPVTGKAFFLGGMEGVGECLIKIFLLWASKAVFFQSSAPILAVNRNGGASCL